MQGKSDWHRQETMVFAKIVEFSQGGTIFFFKLRHSFVSNRGQYHPAASSISGAQEDRADGLFFSDLALSRTVRWQGKWIPHSRAHSFNWEGWPCVLWLWWCGLWGFCLFSSSLVCREVSAFRVSAVCVCYHSSPCVDGVPKQRDHLQLGMQVFGPDKPLECFVLVFCCSNFSTCVGLVIS